MFLILEWQAIILPNSDTDGWRILWLLPKDLRICGLKLPTQALNGDVELNVEFYLKDMSTLHLVTTDPQKQSDSYAAESQWFVCQLKKKQDFKYFFHFEETCKVCFMEMMKGL